MTYSVELFICMILGLALGHAAFNSGQQEHSEIYNKYFETHLQVQWLAKVLILVVLPKLLQNQIDKRSLKKCKFYCLNYKNEKVRELNWIAEPELFLLFNVDVIIFI